jgi:hypothetical protein
MTSQVGDMILENFRISDEDFRDLDSVIRRHCHTIKYYVHKGSSLGDYDTADVEDVVSDRNGAETRIESVLIHATGADGLKFNIEFYDEVAMNGECADRARLVLLATDVRSVIRDRMKGGTPRRKTILQVVAAVFFILGYLGFQQIQNSYANEFNARQMSQVSQSADTADQKQANAAVLSNQKLLSQATTALSRHDLNAEIDFLIQQQIRQRQQSLVAVTRPAIRRLHCGQPLVGCCWRSLAPWLPSRSASDIWFYPAISPCSLLATSGAGKNEPIIVARS